jgi:hypothetical protein
MESTGAAQCFQFGITRTTHAFAVNGDVVQIQEFGRLAEPGQAATLERPAVRRGEDVFKGVVGRNAARQIQKSTKPTFPILSKLNNVGPVDRVPDFTANRNHDDIRQETKRSTHDPRI